MTWYYDPPVRLALQVLLGLFALGVAVVGGVTVAQNPLLVFLVPTVSFGLGWALWRRKHRTIEFKDLSPDERAQALELAWGSGYAPPAPLVPFLIGAFLPAAAAPFVSDEATFQVARLGGWLGAVLVGASMAAAYEYLFVGRNLRTNALRGAAVRWCRHWQEAWLNAGIAAASERAKEKFKMDASAEAHGLLGIYPLLRADMPSPRFDIKVLVVGPFLAIRRGAYLDLYDTSREQAASIEPEKMAAISLGDDSALVAESEVHYRDLVSVDYERTASNPSGAEGVFRVSLANGQRIEFPTSEQHTSSAVESIRLRTRSAKLATG